MTTMQVVQDGGTTVDESVADTQAFFGDPHNIHYIGMLSPPRPGVADCFTMLEHTYFKPGSAENELYKFRVFTWMDIFWGIVSIPYSMRGLMDCAAQVNGLRIAIGVPMMLMAGGVYAFPVNGPRVFTFENLPGHPIYKSGSFVKATDL